MTKIHYEDWRLTAVNHAGGAVPGIVITLVVLVLVLRRQLSTRPLRQRPLIAMILVVVGAGETAPAVSHTPVSHRDIALLVVSLVIGIVLAAVRALTVRIWAEGGRVLRRGTALTAVLWLVSLAQHVAVTAPVSGGLGEATLPVYFGLVLIAQHQILMIRARSQGFRSSS